MRTLFLAALAIPALLLTATLAQAQSPGKIRSAAGVYALHLVAAKRCGDAYRGDTVKVFALGEKFLGGKMDMDLIPEVVTEKDTEFLGYDEATKKRFCASMNRAAKSMNAVIKTSSA